MRKTRYMKYILLWLWTLITFTTLLTACRLPEPVIPDIPPEEEMTSEEDDHTVYYSTDEMTVTVSIPWLDNGVIRVLAEKGQDLVLGDFTMISDSYWRDNEDTPVNGRRYEYREKGLTYQILITWDESITAPGSDTPLTSAMFSLVSAPEICADIMDGDVSEVLRVKFKKQK